MKLPELKGTKSEVKAANHVRNEAIRLFQRSREIVMYKDMIKNINKVYREMVKQTSARWWKNRHYDVFNAHWPLGCVTKMKQHLGLMAKDD